LLYGVASAIPRVSPGVDSLVAGNIRVEVPHDGGAVRVASEAPSSRLRWAWKLDGDRWAFTTSDQQVLVADTFLGPWTAHVALRRLVIRYATGAVVAVRTDDGAWHRIDARGASPIDSLREGVIDVHFFDAQRAYAIRAPGELVASADGGQRWQPVAIPGDVAIRFERDASSSLYVRGGRALYRVDSAGLVASTASTRVTPEVEPAVMERARARWRDHWRANHWPSGATHFSIVHGAVIVPAVETGGALFWTRSGRVHRLARDGATSEAVIEGATGCGLHLFGANILARCDTAGEHAPDKLVELDARTLSQRSITDSLSQIAVMRPSRDGETIAFTMFPGPMTGPGAALWRRSDRQIRTLLGVEREAQLVANGSQLLSIDRAWIRYASLTDDPPRFTDVSFREQGESGFAPTELRASHLREDGGYAVVRTSRGVQGCTMILGSGPTPSNMVRLSACSDPTGIAFVNERFGVVIERTKVWVTRDGGDHWTVVTRALGALGNDAEALLARLPAPVVSEGAIIVAPYQRFTEREGAEEPAWAFRAAQIGWPARDDEPERVLHQGCFTEDGAQRTEPAPLAADARRVSLLFQRTRATVTVRRDAVSVQWSGEDTGAGRYEGPPPWRSPERDFDASEDVGYVIRGASRSGLLLERCLLEDGSKSAQTPTACDVRWLRPSGAPIAIDLQNPPPENAGAWLSHAYPDGGGWVVELSSARRSLYYDWTQWQHLRPNGTIARSGDLVRDGLVRGRVQLARINGAWGAIDADGFAPYGGGERVELEQPDAPGFCESAARASDDVWVVSDPVVSVLPAMGDGADDGAVLRRVGGEWCVARMFERPVFFQWTTAASGVSEAWAVEPSRRAPGVGVFRSLATGGAITSRRVTCDRVENEND
jgi:hypothetical protein